MAITRYPNTGFPGLIAPASLKADFHPEARPSAARGFPGLIAPASLKEAIKKGLCAAHNGFPGLIAPASLKEIAMPQACRARRKVFRG